MKIKMWSAVALIAMMTPAALAQADRKFEFAVGYSHVQSQPTYESETVFVPGEEFTTVYCSAAGRDAFGPQFQQFFCRDKDMNGFSLAATMNVTRYLGIKANFDTHSKERSFVDTFDIGGGETLTTDVRSKERLHTLTAGVQWRDNHSPARFRPFGHVLAGVARQKDRLKLEGAFDARNEETSFAMKIGGGIDWRLTNRIDLRLIEINYVPIFSGDRPLTGEGIEVPITVHGREASNLTVGFGIVVH